MFFVTMSKVMCECLTCEYTFSIPLFYFVFIIVFTESQTRKVPHRPLNNFNFMDRDTASQMEKIT